MDRSRYNLLKKLKEMSEIYEKERKISHEVLIEFCWAMVSSSLSSLTFVSMYDGCVNFRSDRNSYKREFYQLSRYIDREIVKRKSQEYVFKRYDKAMDEFYGSKNSIKNMAAVQLTEEYKKSGDIFNFNLLQEEMVVEKSPQSYQFDPVNLMV